MKDEEDILAAKDSTTKASSFITNLEDFYKDNEDDNDDFCEEEEEELFAINNGFFCFARKMKNIGSTPYGRIVEEDSIRELEKINLIKDDDSVNSDDSSQSFDFYEDLLDLQTFPKHFKFQKPVEKLNFLGLSEGYSMEILLKQMNVQTLVIINGSIEESKRLKEAKLDAKKVRIVSGEYSTKIQHSRVQAHLDGSIRPEDVTPFKELKSHGLSYSGVRLNVKVPAPKNGPIEAKGARLTIVGETKGTSAAHKKYSSLDKFRLIEFRQFLEEQGIESKLECGQLNIHNKVYVVQNQGNIYLEGVFSEQFYQVRKILYKMMLILNE